MLAIKIPFMKNEVASTWVEIENSINFIVNNDTDDDKRSVLEQFICCQIELINKRTNETFSQGDLNFALSRYSKSRAAYNNILKNIVLPSTRTLRRITNNTYMTMNF